MQWCMLMRDQRTITVSTNTQAIRERQDPFTQPGQGRKVSLLLCLADITKVHRITTVVAVTEPIDMFVG